MNTTFYSLAARGLGAELVKIEVENYASQPGTVIVGLGDKAVQESKERVRAAIKNCDFFYPRGKVVINLAPADLPKSGPCFDLPIALGLIALGNDWSVNCDSTVFFGELTLDGRLQHVNGILGLAAEAKARGFLRVVVPSSDAAEAALIPDLEIYGADDLIQVVQFLRGEVQLRREFQTVSPHDPFLPDSNSVDMVDIKGQAQAKRALEIAAAGSHNVLLCGSPGSGKTLLARSLRSILPALSLQESLEVTKLYSLCGMLPQGQTLIRQRPFRTIHHTASATAIVGGGSVPRPGEISLAHRGVLFMDELAEFPSSVLEALRQPVEDRQITISRASGSLTYPSQFLLCGAMNPCPCGFYQVPHSKKACECLPYQITRYQGRLSGPLMDRIDLHCAVSPLEQSDFSALPSGDTSEAVRERVNSARERQRLRFEGMSLAVNAEMSTKDLERLCPLSAESKNILELAVESLHLSARGYYRVIRVARTIADLQACEGISVAHVSEALQYRRRE
ncbi:MAG: YifB family Mg chelatase-like AAA ATPase [bacterium]|nr:YifB family Mg chelatase-like AAA ATPase [bacterium]